MAIRPDGIIVAIDGPSGAGKSTVARQLAARLGYLQIDTGAMYRAAALSLSRAGIDLDDLDAVERFCRQLDVTLELADGVQLVRANGEDVTSLIRSPEMSLLTSRTAALRPVREAMLNAQQLMGRRGGVVLEGRDIGTVVFPDAEVKFFLSASVEERARRRCEELVGKGETVTFAETVADVVRRDRQDSERDIAPLRQADDALLVDSSDLSVHDVLDMMETICRDRIESIRQVP